MSQIDQQFEEYSTWRKGLFDAISDFQHTYDDIDLSAIDANAAANGNNLLTNPKIPGDVMA